MDKFLDISEATIKWMLIVLTPVLFIAQLILWAKNH